MLLYDFLYDSSKILLLSSCKLHFEDLWSNRPKIVPAFLSYFNVHSNSSYLAGTCSTPAPEVISIS